MSNPEMGRAASGARTEPALPPAQSGHRLHHQDENVLDQQVVPGDSSASGGGFTAKPRRASGPGPNAFIPELPLPFAGGASQESRRVASLAESMTDVLADPKTQSQVQQPLQQQQQQQQRPQPLSDQSLGPHFSAFGLANAVSGRSPQFLQRSGLLKMCAGSLIDATLGTGEFSSADSRRLLQLPLQGPRGAPVGPLPVAGAAATGQDRSPGKEFAQAVLGLEGVGTAGGGLAAAAGGGLGSGAGGAAVGRWGVSGVTAGPSSAAATQQLREAIRVAGLHSLTPGPRLPSAGRSFFPHRERAWARDHSHPIPPHQQQQEQGTEQQQMPSAAATAGVTGPLTSAGTGHVAVAVRDTDDGRGRGDAVPTLADAAKAVVEREASTHAAHAEQLRVLAEAQEQQRRDLETLQRRQREALLALPPGSAATAVASPGAAARLAAELGPVLWSPTLSPAVALGQSAHPSASTAAAPSAAFAGAADCRLTSPGPARGMGAGAGGANLLLLPGLPPLDAFGAGAGRYSGAAAGASLGLVSGAWVSGGIGVGTPGGIGGGMGGGGGPSPIPRGPSLSGLSAFEAYSQQQLQQQQYQQLRQEFVQQHAQIDEPHAVIAQSRLLQAAQQQCLQQRREWDTSSGGLGQADPALWLSPQRAPLVPAPQGHQVLAVAQPWLGPQAMFDPLQQPRATAARAVGEAGTEGAAGASGATWSGLRGPPQRPPGMCFVQPPPTSGPHSLSAAAIADMSSIHGAPAKLTGGAGVGGGGVTYSVPGAVAGPGPGAAVSPRLAAGAAAALSTGSAHAPQWATSDFRPQALARWPSSSTSGGSRGSGSTAGTGPASGSLTGSRGTASSHSSSRSQQELAAQAHISQHGQGQGLLHGSAAALDPDLTARLRLLHLHPAPQQHSRVAHGSSADPLAESLGGFVVAAGGLPAAGDGTAAATEQRKRDHGRSVSAAGSPRFAAALHSAALAASGALMDAPNGDGDGDEHGLAGTPHTLFSSGMAGSLASALSAPVLATTQPTGAPALPQSAAFAPSFLGRAESPSALTPRRAASGAPAGFGPAGGSGGGGGEPSPDAAGLGQQQQQQAGAGQQQRHNNPDYSLQFASPALSEEAQDELVRAALRRGGPRGAPALPPPLTPGSRRTGHWGAAAKALQLAERVHALLPGAPGFVYVSSVIHGGPAEAGGLRGGDVLLQLGRLDRDAYVAAEKDPQALAAVVARSADRALPFRALRADDPSLAGAVSSASTPLASPAVGGSGSAGGSIRPVELSFFFPLAASPTVSGAHGGERSPVLEVVGSVLPRLCFSTNYSTQGGAGAIGCVLCPWPPDPRLMGPQQPPPRAGEPAAAAAPR